MVTKIYRKSQIDNYLISEYNLLVMCCRLEEKITYLCAKLPFTEEDGNQLKPLLSLKVNWHSLLEIAARYGILPLAIKNMLGVESKFIPRHALERIFRRSHQEYTINNLILWEEFKKILQITRNRQIPILPIKGIINTEILYSDPGLRRTSDIDFLIKREDLDNICRISTELGYALVAKDTEKHFHLYARKNNPPGIEIGINAHWDILSPKRRIDKFVAECWDSAALQEISGENILIPSCEDMLFIAMIELYKDVLSSRDFIVKRHLDISIILSKFGPQIDWIGFIKRAHSYGLDNLAYYAIWSNRDSIKNADLLQDGLRKLKPNLIRRLFMRVIPKKDNPINKKKLISHFPGAYYIFISELILMNRWRVFFSMLLDSFLPKSKRNYNYSK